VKENKRIVSLPKIEAFTTSSIEVGGKELPIGRSFKSKVLGTLHVRKPVMAD